MIDVVWEVSARDALDAVWAAAAEADLPALEAAVQGLLADLLDDPLEVGESRGGPVRVAVRPPLTVWLEVLDDGRRVRIVRVRRPTRRG